MKDYLLAYIVAACNRYKDPVVQAILVMLFVIAAVNIFTKLEDAQNFGAPIPWQNPFITETSSAVAFLILLPLLFEFFSRNPLTTVNWRSKTLSYFIASICLSVAHIGIMVAIRKVAWPLTFDGPYVFFHSYVDVSLYEYRKDLVTFLLNLAFFSLFTQIRQKKAIVEPLILKSGATTIHLRPADFIFAKSAGNYVEVTSESGEHLARITLSDLEKILREKNCDVVRVHKSTILNKALIQETNAIANGDITVKLNTGHEIRASRRYRENLDLVKSL